MLLPLKLFGIVFLIPGLIVLCHGLRLGKRLKREYRFDAETTGTITGISLYTDSYSDQQSTSGVLTYEYWVNGERITYKERITKIGGHRFFCHKKLCWIPLKLTIRQGQVRRSTIVLIIRRFHMFTEFRGDITELIRMK